MEEEKNNLSCLQQHTLIIRNIKRGMAILKTVELQKELRYIQRKVVAGVINLQLKEIICKIEYVRNSI